MYTGILGLNNSLIAHIIMILQKNSKYLALYLS